MAARPADDPGSKARLLLLVNPHASRVSTEVRDRVASVLRHRYEVEVAETDSPAGSTEAAAGAAAAGVEVAAALGGDGTARSVAGGVAGTDTALACLPAGSRNVFARMLGAADDPLAVARRVAGEGARRQRVDLGLISGRRFLFAASVGVGARTNEQLNRHPWLKARAGAAYGLVAALGTAAAYLGRPPRMRVRAGDREIDAVSLIFQNARPLTYVGERPLDLCERVGLTSGTVSIAVLRRLLPADLVGIPARLMFRSTEDVLAHRHVDELDGVTRAEIRVLGDRAIPLDLDGDYAGRFEQLELGVAPGSLAVLA